MSDDEFCGIHQVSYLIPDCLECPLCALHRWLNTDESDGVPKDVLEGINLLFRSYNQLTNQEGADYGT
jgi:hypothetical protein